MCKLDDASRHTISRRWLIGLLLWCQTQSWRCMCAKTSSDQPTVRWMLPTLRGKARPSRVLSMSSWSQQWMTARTSRFTSSIWRQVRATCALWTSDRRNSRSNRKSKSKPCRWRTSTSSAWAIHTSSVGITRMWLSLRIMESCCSLWIKATNRNRPGSENWCLIMGSKLSVQSFGRAKKLMGFRKWLKFYKGGKFRSADWL